jgi:hypothetical protein
VVFDDVMVGDFVDAGVDVCRDCPMMFDNVCRILAFPVSILTILTILSFLFLGIDKFLEG